MKEICALDTEIIVTWIDDVWTVGIVKKALCFTLEQSIEMDIINVTTVMCKIDDQPNESVMGQKMNAGHIWLAKKVDDTYNTVSFISTLLLLTADFTFIYIFRCHSSILNTMNHSWVSRVAVVVVVVVLVVVVVVDVVVVVLEV